MRIVNCKYVNCGYSSRLKSVDLYKSTSEVTFCIGLQIQLRVELRRIYPTRLATPKSPHSPSTNPGSATTTVRAAADCYFWVPHNMRDIITSQQTL